MNLAIVRQQIHNLLLALPELAEDEILTHDMLEAETDAIKFLRAIECLREEAELLATAIKDKIDVLKQRQSRMERRDEALRKLLLTVLQTANLRKVELPEATISVRNGAEKLVINDEASVPHEYCAVKYTPHKAWIKELLKAGKTFNWAALIQGEPGVTIRTK